MQRNRGILVVPLFYVCVGGAVWLWKLLGGGVEEHVLHYHHQEEDGEKEAEGEEAAVAVRVFGDITCPFPAVWVKGLFGIDPYLYFFI